MKLSRTWNAVLALSLLSASVASPVRADGLTTASTKVALAVIFAPTIWGVGMTAAGAITLGAGIAATAASTTAVSIAEVEKQALAQTALEDAAHYYETGELSGILPSAVTRIRELSPEMSKANDAEVVDLIVDAASLIAQ